MGAFDEKYTGEQREACARAKLDRGLTGRQVAGLAAAGDLTLDGKRLEPFTISAEYAIELAAKLRAQRQGKVVSDLASLPPRDAIEALRRRLVNVADAELASVEKQKTGVRDLKRFREVIACVKEAAALPGPKDPRPVAPGEREGGRKTTGSQTRAGVGGALLAAHRSQTQERPADQAGLSNGDGAG